jgi:hypothetical protein
MPRIIMADKVLLRRVTVECRNGTGQSLLSIAAQNNDVELAEYLLTHWKTCDKDRCDFLFFSGLLLGGFRV